MAFGWIDEEAERRRRAGLVRTLRPRPADSPLLDLARTTDLGLARHPEVTEGAARAAGTWGGGATGSRLVTGTTALHAELERELADFCGFEAALVFSSGYAANLAAVTALAPHGSLIVSDAGNHASLIDGCRLARGTTQVVGHADPDAVGKALRTHEAPPSWCPTRSSRWTATRPRWPPWPRRAGSAAPVCWSTTPTDSASWVTEAAPRRRRVSRGPTTSS
ncbi:8-amino-7-oxononanoate synthase [Streptomyces alboniger]